MLPFLCGIFKQTTLVIIGLTLSLVSSTVNHSIYWSPQNPLFRNGFNKIMVRVDDNIIILCPRYYDFSNKISVFWTTDKAVYDSCGRNAESTKWNYWTEEDSRKILFTCTRNELNPEYRIVVSRFSWVASNPSFNPNSPIYFLPQRDLCQRFGMRFEAVLNDDTDKNDIQSEQHPQPRAALTTQGSSVGNGKSGYSSILVLLLVPLHFLLHSGR